MPCISSRQSVPGAAPLKVRAGWNAHYAGRMVTFPITCGHCGHQVGAEIIADADGGNARPGTYMPSPFSVLWLRCPVCEQGSVRTKTGALVPGCRPGRVPVNIPEDVERAWNEARSAHSVSAYTAAEIMCRKILMHLAVDVASAQSGKSFAHYIDELDKAGYITAGLKPVVDQVRVRGNAANHDLPASSEQDSLQTLKITEHLLEAIYELPGLAIPAPQQGATGSNASQPASMQ